MSHMARRSAPKPVDEFHAYLRSLQTRAIDISQTMAKLQLRERAPNWPRLLSQFAILCAQLQTLYDELLTNDRVWSSRLHASLSLCQPLSAAYNPATALRVKPTVEADQFEQQAFDAFREDTEFADYSAVNLRDQLNDYNQAALKLGRWATQAAALPLPREPPAPALQVGGVVRSKADIDRIEETELQKTLASMMTGRQTKLETPQAQQPSQQPQLPPHIQPYSQQQMQQQQQQVRHH